MLTNTPFIFGDGDQGGGANKPAVLPCLVGTVLGIVYGRLTPMGVALSPCELAVKLELSGIENPMTLLRMAL